MTQRPPAIDVPNTIGTHLNSSVIGSFLDGRGVGVCATTESGSGLADPVFTALRCPPLETVADRFQLLLGLRLVDMQHPLSRTIDGPGREETFRSVLAPPQAAPSPILARSHRFARSGVAFDITQHRQQVVIFFDWQGLESALIQMPCSFGVMVSMPSHCMRVGKAPKETDEEKLTGV